MVIKLEFVDFVVSDSPTAYPDGGEQGGYWYEKVKEFTPYIFGFTKIAIDEKIFSSDTQLTNMRMSHSLGAIPTAFILNAEEDVLLSSNLCIQVAAGVVHPNTQYTLCAIHMRGNNTVLASTVTMGTSSNKNTDSEMFFDTTARCKAGVKYRLITMA